MQAQNWGQVTLLIPATPEYVGTARLTILGVAGRMGFTYDQVEDIRLAVGEACANAIERVQQKLGENAHDTHVTIRCYADSTKLTVEVEDGTVSSTVHAEGVDLERPASEVAEMNSQELGALLMEILVDEVAVETASNGGALVRLTKYANAL